MPDGEGAWGWRARTMGRILAFAVPALAIPLADPLLSVVDAVIIAQVRRGKGGEGGMRILFVLFVCVCVWSCTNVV